jgi:xylan 1,4-beta-xylosidase
MECGGRASPTSGDTALATKHTGQAPVRVYPGEPKRRRHFILRRTPYRAHDLFHKLVFWIVLAACTLGMVRAAEPFAVRIQVDAANPKGPLKPIWRFFGADEPNYAYMVHGSKLLRELGQFGADPVYFRAHNLLTSGDGTPALKWGSTGVYREDSDGHTVYDWTILDRIFDIYLGSGIRPYVEIGFMPKDLSTKPEPYQHHWTPQAQYNEIYTGWTHPPKDYGKWAELVFQWTSHCVDRYGRAEVDRWFWEVWNEPNIGYWRGTPEEFLKLHDYAIDAVRRALPTARVGGADTAGSGGAFTRRFLEHCLHGTNYASGRIGTPLDFVSFHAKGSPTYVDGYVRMGIAQELRTVREGFQIVSSFPELKGKPVVIGECDPEGCAACQGSALAYRNGTMYSSYTAASFARLYDLATSSGVNLEGALTWAFEFEGQPYFAGFRSLASNGIDKPVLNVFRMLGRMRGQRLGVQSDGAVPLEELLREGVRNRPDVSALASLGEKELCVLAWHYHDDDVTGPDGSVELVFDHLPLAAGDISLRHFRIDRLHSNAYTAWQEMGSPQQPTPDQYAQLERAGQLTEMNPPPPVQVTNGKSNLRFDLPRQAVSLLQLTWK